MYKLCTAEKPSVGRAIAKVLGANKKEDGYYIGNGYIVTWCFGHLVTFSEPEKYGDEYIRSKEFDKNLLPIFPDKIGDNRWKLTIKKDCEHQFNVIKQLMHRADVDLIIDCGDDGAEGYYLQWLVRFFAGCKKPVKNFKASSFTDKKIQEAMNNLEDISLYENVIKGEMIKRKGDWLIGINFSRWYSRYIFDTKGNYSYTGVDIGRVLTPTLNFVVERYLANKNFKSSPYWQIKTSFIQGFNGIVKTSSENRFTDKDTALTILNALCPGTQGTITTLNTTKKTTNPPQLYDIDELESDGNKLYGYTPIEVLNIVQGLYEKYKIVTYPRTDSRYLTNDLVPEVKERIKELRAIMPYQSLMNEHSDFSFDLFSERIVDESKVTDHHAIIITEEFKNFDISLLNEKELNILNLIIIRMLVALSPSLVYNETEIEVSIHNYIICNKFKNIIDPGFELILNPVSKNTSSKEPADEYFNANLHLFDTVIISESTLLEKMTTAPQLHTGSTLLKAMVHASNSIEDNNELKDLIKGIGIGTKATRAGIIENLFLKGFAQYSGKGTAKYIIPTEKGIKTIEAVHEYLKTPKMTAEWEKQFNLVCEGKISENDFNSFINNSIETIFYNLKNGGGKEVDYIESNSNSSDREVFGRCVYCGGNIINIKGKDYDYFACDSSGKKDADTKCNFRIYRNKGEIVRRSHKELTDSDVKKLLQPRGLTKKCIDKEGREYKANFKPKLQPKVYEGHSYIDFDIINVTTGKVLN